MNKKFVYQVGNNKKLNERDLQIIKSKPFEDLIAL